MTPAQEKALAVALDGLREVGFDEKRLGLVPELLGEKIPMTWLRIGMKVRDEAGRQVDMHAGGGVSYYVHSIDVEAIARPFFSPAETPTAASAHRPETPARLVSDPFGNLPPTALCPSCKQPIGNAKCWDCYGTRPAQSGA